MNIFEIISLNENIERVPGQNLWRVIYPDDMDRVPDILPTQEKAQARYDQEVEQWNNSSRQRRQQEREANRQRARNQRDRERQAREQARRQTGTPQQRNELKSRLARNISRSRKIIRLAGVLGVSYASYQEAADNMVDAYGSFAAGDIDLATYEAMQRRYFGQWAMTLVIPQLLVAIRASVATIRAAIRYLTPIRAANLTSSVAMAAGGPVGILLGIIKFVLIEGGIWAAAYLLTTSERVQNALAKYLVTSVILGAVADASTSILQMEARWMDYVINDLADFDAQSLRAAAQDIDQIAGLDDESIQQRYQDEIGSTSSQDIDGDGQTDYRGQNNPDTGTAQTPTTGNDRFVRPGMN